MSSDTRRKTSQPQTPMEQENSVGVDSIANELIYDWTNEVNDFSYEIKRPDIDYQPVSEYRKREQKIETEKATKFIEYVLKSLEMVDLRPAQNLEDVDGRIKSYNVLTKIDKVNFVDPELQRLAEDLETTRQKFRGVVETIIDQSKINKSQEIVEVYNVQWSAKLKDAYSIIVEKINNFSDKVSELRDLIIKEPSEKDEEYRKVVIEKAKKDLNKQSVPEQIIAELPEKFLLDMPEGTAFNETIRSYYLKNQELFSAWVADKITEKSVEQNRDSAYFKNEILEALKKKVTAGEEFWEELKFKLDNQQTDKADTEEEIDEKSEEIDPDTEQESELDSEYSEEDFEQELETELDSVDSEPEPESDSEQSEPEPDTEQPDSGPEAEPEPEQEEPKETSIDPQKYEKLKNLAKGSSVNIIAKDAEEIYSTLVDAALKKQVVFNVTPMEVLKIEKTPVTEEQENIEYFG